jgi:hypothetical protein
MCVMLARASSEGHACHYVCCVHGMHVLVHLLCYCKSKSADAMLHLAVCMCKYLPEMLFAWLSLCAEYMHAHTFTHTDTYMNTYLCALRAGSLLEIGGSLAGWIKIAWACEFGGELLRSWCCVMCPCLYVCMCACVHACMYLRTYLRTCGVTVDTQARDTQRVMSAVEKSQCVWTYACTYVSRWVTQWQLTLTLIYIKPYQGTGHPACRTYNTGVRRSVIPLGRRCTSMQWYQSLPVPSYLSLSLSLSRSSFGVPVEHEHEMCYSWSRGMNMGAPYLALSVFGMSDYSCLFV